MVGTQNYKIGVSFCNLHPKTENSLAKALKKK